jgi:hypothetical protein
VRHLVLDDVRAELRDAELASAAEAVGRAQDAAVHRVPARVVQREEVRAQLALGEVEAGHPAHGLDGVVQRGGELGAEAGQLLAGRQPVEAAEADVDRVDGAPAEDLDDRVAGLLEPQPALHERAPVAGEGQGVRQPQEVRRVQEVDVQGVALDPLAPVEEPAQLRQWPLDGDAARRLDRLAGAHLVGDRADAADPGGDVRRLRVGAAAEQGLEEPRRLVDVELDALDRAVPHGHAQRGLALDPGQRADLEPATAAVAHDSSVRPAAVRPAAAAKGGDAALNVLNTRCTPSSDIPSARSCATSAVVFAPRTGPKQP